MYKLKKYAYPRARTFGENRYARAAVRKIEIVSNKS